MKLVRRGHAMPRGLHANLFLVRRAGDIMERDLAVMDEATRFADFLAMQENVGGLRHVAVTRRGHIVGVLRVNIDLRRAAGGLASEATLGELARRNFTVVREDAATFDVIVRMRRKRASMALVIPAGRARSERRILGVISKEHIADNVASSIGLYPR